MADSSNPLKRCSRGDACVHPEGPWLPATLEYFHKKQDGKYGLNSYCRLCARQRATDWAKRNPEKASERTGRWERNNREKRNQIKRNWYHSEGKEVRAIKRREKYHREGGAARLRERRAKRPWLYRLFWHLRITRKRSLPDTLTNQEWQATLHDWDHHCAVCGATDDITADHWIPLASPDCAGTTKNNMIPLCGSCNYSKSDNDPLEWMTWRFGRDYAIERFEAIAAYLAQF